MRKLLAGTSNPIDISYVQHHGIPSCLAKNVTILMGVQIANSMHPSFLLIRLRGVAHSSFFDGFLLSCHHSSFVFVLKFVPRSVVMNSLREIDPSGTSDRRRHRLTRRTYFSLGPNFCWHIDGYDKLEPYGFPIHGCIDGYSRKIIWLELLSSNNDPFAISRLYIKANLEVVRNACAVIVDGKCWCCCHTVVLKKKPF